MLVGFCARGVSAPAMRTAAAPISEEAAGDEVGDGLVVVLPGKGAEFDREEEGVLVGEGADIVGGAGNAGGSSDAAEAEGGGALDAGGEGHQVNGAGCECGGGGGGDMPCGLMGWGW